MTNGTLHEVAVNFHVLPGVIAEMGSFEEQWKKVLGSKEASNDKVVVYIWTTSRPIPRLRGESNIIYIGKTINSIQARHFQYAKLEANGERNRPRYQHILKHFGPIRFHVAPYNAIASDPTEAEKKLLKMYFEKHLEYPPFNRNGK